MRFKYLSVGLPTIRYIEYPVFTLLWGKVPPHVPLHPCYLRTRAIDGGHRSSNEMMKHFWHGCCNVLAECFHFVIMFPRSPKRPIVLDPL